MHNIAVIPYLLFYTNYYIIVYDFDMWLTRLPTFN